MKTVEPVPGKRIMGRLPHGSDLLDALTNICRDNGITLGRVEAIGAMKKAVMGFYNQATRKYEYHEWNEPVELLGLVGNVSVKDGKPMVHAHVTLADSKGAAFGGHLCSGTVVFACEFIIEAMSGEKLVRGMDDETGLPLWK